MGAFKIIHANIEATLKATGIVDGESTLNRNAKSAAHSAFEGTKQRFFGHLLTGMKCPALIRAIEAGRSAIIQLVSTGEALMERRIAEIPASEWDDLTIDLTPRDGILSFLMHAFPVHLQEPFTDDGGTLMSRPVVDAGGNPVICREAEARRDALIEKLAALPPVPAGLGQSRRDHRLHGRDKAYPGLLHGRRHQAQLPCRSVLCQYAAPMPKFLNRLLALPIAGRETLYAHPGTGAKTELVEIIRRDKLEPLSAGDVLEAASRHAGTCARRRQGPRRARRLRPRRRSRHDRGRSLRGGHGLRCRACPRQRLATVRRRTMGAARVEIEGPTDTDTASLKCLGCTVEIVSWRARVFAPDAGVLERILERRPLAA